ncbi:MAG: tetratricopeptide repeat protein [Acidobacteria bacterium]|nr:tetratricopeptide repeat protein [Acidobacteriota bacterium]MBI3421975.1 tetratricopeptide repeat protein [Acidobacteriota bacterium]
MTHSTLGLVYEQQGKWPEALAEFNESRCADPKQPFTLGHLGHAYALAGQRGEALRMLAEMKSIAAQDTYVDPVAVAFVHAGLGDKDGAFAELEQAYQARDENLIHYKDAPLFDGLRADPRFADLLRRLRLTP